MYRGAADFFIQPVTKDVLQKKIDSIYNEIISSQDDQKNISTKEIDITQKFNINLNSKKLLQIFDLSKTQDKIKFNDLMQAVIACNMYNYKNVVLDFGNMATSCIDIKDLKKLKNLVEHEGGKFFIISKNDELTKTLAITELFEYIIKSQMQAEKRISS